MFLMNLTEKRIQETDLMKLVFDHTAVRLLQDQEEQGHVQPNVLRPGFLKGLELWGSHDKRNPEASSKKSQVGLAMFVISMKMAIDMHDIDHSCTPLIKEKPSSNIKTKGMGNMSPEEKVMVL